jgi:formylglycine-generating enzyme required for sulfatase activity
MVRAGGVSVIAVRCPHCLHAWSTPPTDGPLACPVCGGAVVATPAAAVETGFSLPLPSVSTSDGGGCAPASVGGPHPFLAPPQGPGEVGRLGRYRVLRELGAGGMGVVFEAEDTRLDRRVALKVMRLEAAADKDGRARFLREAKAAASLDHEHIVPVFDLGEENGAPYLVLPLLRGESLEARLRRQRPLPLAEALRITREMAEGLAAAHEAGLVHRDVKPANVWLSSPGGRVKLLDFGLARLAEGDPGMTRSGAVLGTPAYMAPEQITDPRKVDGRADLFSLGALLFEMLTGRRAFQGQTRDAVLISVATARPPAPHVVNPAVPPEVSDLVLRLLEKAPTQRPSSARQVARQLGALAAPPAESLHLSRQGRPPAAAAGKRRWWAAAVAVALLLPLGWALWPRGQAPAPGPTPDTPSGQRIGPTVDQAGAAAFAAAWHTAADVEARSLRAARRDALQRRQAALAFAESLSLSILEEAATQRANRVLEAIRRDREQEASRAALAFGGALHDAAQAGAPAQPPSFVNSVGMKMIRIKSGRFRMGAPRVTNYASGPDEQPQHEVEISRAFYLAETPVTVGQFRRFVEEVGHTPESVRDGQGGFGYDEATGSLPGPHLRYNWKNTGWKQTDDHPVVNVTWNDAVAFCKWLSAREKKEYRLPTEAEWEYACRAGTSTRFYFGDDEDELVRYANVADASFRRKLPGERRGMKGDDGFAFTAPVKSFKANPWGLYDMHGNVWQWCADGKRKYEAGSRTDPIGPDSAERVLHGGSWYDVVRFSCVTIRHYHVPSVRETYIGFRFACSPAR